MEDRQRQLSKFDLFAGLGDRDLSEVAQIVRRRHLEADAPLFHRGDDGVEICLVVSGRLKAFVTSADGHDRVFRHMGSGDVIGELAVFAEGKRTANVTAVEDCELLMIQRRELIPVLRRCPEVAIRLLGALAERTIELSDALADSKFRPVSERLAKFLLHFAERWGKPDESGGRMITVRLPQGDLGAIVGATRESINKTVKDWDKEKIVEMRNGWITIRDQAALEARSDRSKALDGKSAATASGPAKRSPAETSATPNPGTARSVSLRKSGPA